LLGELSAGAQPGLRFAAAAALGAGDAAVSRVIDAALYAVAIPASVARALGGHERMLARIEAAFASRELVIVRRIDGIGKRVDVRAFLRRVELDAESGRAALAAAGIVGDFVPLAVEVDVRGSGGVKIAEVV